MKVSLILILFLTSLSGAQSSKELLANGLFAEEAENDLKTASKNYEAILEAYKSEHQVAAVALYRLAEVRRKQNDLKGATVLLRRLVTEFPGVEPQQRLARENLEALGEALPVNGGVTIDHEQQELNHLKELAITSPDVRIRKASVETFVSNGWFRVIDYLIEVQGLESLDGALQEAAGNGNLSMIKKLVEAGIDPNAEEALGTAVEKGFDTITRYLVGKGATLRKSAPATLRTIAARRGDQISVLQKALAAGSDVDFNAFDQRVHKSSSSGWLSVPCGTALLEAIRKGNEESAEFLLKKGADPNLLDSEGDVSPLQLAVAGQLPGLVQSLLEAGAKVDYETKRGNMASGSLLKPGQKTGIISNLNIDLETLKLLVAADCPIPGKLLPELAGKGNLELVKVLVGNGVEVDHIPEGYNRGTPLSCALSEGQFEVAEFLRENGAKVEKVHWQWVSSDLRLKWNRELRYPEWAKSDLVTFVMPELALSKKPGFGGLLGQLKPERALVEEILKFPFPSQVAFFNRRENVTVFQPDKIVWNLVRGKERTEVNFGSGGLPKFQAGDIVEVTGFARKNDGVLVQKVTPLGEIQDNGFVRGSLLELKDDQPKETK